MASMFHIAPTNFANLLADRPAPRGVAGGAGGDPPAKAKRRLLRYFKKANYYLVATNWGGTKQKQITKNNRFEKQQISKISHFRKQHISKTTTNEKKSKFLKTTDLKKEQICCVWK